VREASLRRLSSKCSLAFHSLITGSAGQGADTSENGMAVVASLHHPMTVDFLRDGAPVGAIVDYPMVMVRRLSFPARTVPEFIAHAKANPGKTSFVSFGTGATSHLGGLFNLMVGVDLVHASSWNSSSADRFGG
jgi:tripartite-type tricarboxylate transporter receptor subunit TctC